MPVPGKQPHANSDQPQPLRLADEADASGSVPVPTPSSGEASRAPAGETPNETSRSGSSLDTMLGKIVVERGLMSPDELEQCSSQLRAKRDGVSLTLADVLVEREFITRKQLDRFRFDIEAVKTSQQIPGYRIIRKLGAGAMATVFLAKQLSLDRLVAIKVLPKKFSTNPNFIERFYKEGRAAAKLNHNNIVAAVDVGQAGEHHYFVMEYVDGDTVYDRIVARKRVPEREALEIIRQVASALQHAHEMGFVHRDIKPKNIMMTTSGVAKLADLGLARGISDKEAAEAESGRAFGTPYYIAPEQIRGSVDIGPPADIYGLGATFYHMVTGKVPYEGTTPSQVMHKHLKAPLVPPDHLNPQISAGTALIIETMLKKDARERYQNAKQLLRDLDLVASGQEPEHAKPHVDLSTIATAVNGTTAQPAPVVRKDAGGMLANPLMVTLAAIAAISVIANIVLGIMLLAR
jgi:eukaryotic-like serine/threonine-protein kinase